MKRKSHMAEKGLISFRQEGGRELYERKCKKVPRRLPIRDGSGEFRGDGKHISGTEREVR